MAKCLHYALIHETEMECEIRGLPCKRWDCEHCQPMRRAQLWDLARSGHPTIFITLTASNEAGEEPDAIARGLVRSWRNVLQRGRREGKFARLEYLCVFEETKRGRPHLHILVRGPYIDQHWLSERMDQYLSSPIVDVRAVRNAHKAAGYIAKYVSKAPWRWQGCKRYWRTQHWRMTGRDQDDTPCADKGWWRVRWWSWSAEVDEYLRRGWVTVDDDGAKWTGVRRRRPPPLPPVKDWWTIPGQVILNYSTSA